MEEASQDNSQESQEEMQQSQEEASSQELPAASGKTSPEAGDMKMSSDKGEGEEEEEEEEEEEWPPKFPTTLEGFGYAFNKGRVGYGLIPRLISLCMGMRPRLTKVST